MKKRKLLAGLFVATAALGLASCANSNTEKPVNPDDQQQEQEKPAEKTLSSITVAGGKTDFTVGDTFDKGSLVVTAKYSDNTVAVVTSSAVVDSSAVKMDTAGTYEVKVTYQGKEAKYSVTVTAVVVTEIEIEADDTNAKVDYEVGETFTAEGLKLDVIYSDDSEASISDLTGYTVKLTDANNTEVTGAFTAPGIYTVTISKGELTTDYEVIVIKKQVKFNFEYNTNGYEVLAADPGTTMMVSPNEVLYDNGYGTKVAAGSLEYVFTRVFSDPNAEGDTTSSVEFEGKTYSGIIGLNGTHKNDGQELVVTVAAACKIEILAKANGSSNTRVLTCSNGQIFTTTTEVQKFTFDLAAAGDYKFYSSNSTINLYNINVIYSYDEDTVTANDSMSIEGYENEFTTTGDTAFNMAAPQGLVVKSYNNKGAATVLTSGYTVSVKDANDAAVTAITTPGVYTVSVAIDGTELVKTYEITVTNPNATITAVEVTKGEDTVVKFYGDDAFDAADLTVVATDSDNLTKTLTAVDYTVKLLSGTTEVTEFTTTGEYTVEISYGGQSATYVVNYYAASDKVIIADDISTSVAVGSTTFENSAYAVQTYEDEGDDTDVVLDTEVSYALYSDSACTTAIADATAAFAAEGTVYAKFTAEGCADVIVTITVKNLSEMNFVAETHLAEVAKGAAVALGTKYDDSFTIKGTKEAKRANSSTFALQLESKGANYLEFSIPTGKAANITLKIQATGSDKTVTAAGIYLAGETDTLVVNNENASSHTGTSETAEWTYSKLTSGTYKIQTLDTATGMRLLSCNVVLEDCQISYSGLNGATNAEGWKVEGANGTTNLSTVDNGVNISTNEANAVAALVKVDVATVTEGTPSAYTQSAKIGDGTKTSVIVNILAGSSATANSFALIVEALDAEGNVIGTATCYTIKGYDQDGDSTKEKVTGYCQTVKDVTASADGYDSSNMDIVVSVSEANAGKTIDTIRVYSTEKHHAIVEMVILF